MATDVEGLEVGRAGERAAAGSGVSNPVLILLIWLIGASGCLLLIWGSKLTFLLDDWEFLLYRRDLESVFEPHGEHISVLPVLIYKGLLATVGMDSALPFRVVSTALFLLSALLLFVFLKRRVGQWAALAGTAVVLFLGSAWEDLLWAFQVGYFGSMACGLGALLALERGDRRGDRLAVLLLVLAVLFSSLGLPFLAGVAVLILWRSDRWRRIHIVAIPAAVFAAWWLGWGHDAESAISFANLAKTPHFVLDGLAGSLSSAFGLNVPGVSETAGGLEWGRPLLVGSLVLAGWRLSRLRPVPSWLWVAVAIGGAFWVLAGLNQIPGRTAVASRYQYVGVIFTMLVAAELLRGVRIRSGALVAVFVVAAAAVVSNVYLLHESYLSYRQTSQLEKADLAAVEIARDTVEPGFVLSEDLADTAYVHVEAGAYLSARDTFGSPAYTPAELAESPEFARFAADKVLFGALGIELVPAPASSLPAEPPAPAEPGANGLAAVPAGGCVSVAPEGGVSPLLGLPSGGVAIEAGSQPVTAVRMARFAGEAFPVELTEPIAAGGVAELAIPADRSSLPWRAELVTTGTAIVCGREHGRSSG